MLGKDCSEVFTEIKKSYCKVLLGLIISSISQMNSLLPVEQQLYQKSIPGETVKNQIFYSLVF